MGGEADRPPGLDRRTALALGLGLGAAGAARRGEWRAGAGTDLGPDRDRRGRRGRACHAANRLVAGLDGAEITLVDGRAAHYYQPGFTLVGAGLKAPELRRRRARATTCRAASTWSRRRPPRSTRRPTSSSPPRASGWPTITLSSRAGLELNYGGIEGMDIKLDRDGRDRLGLCEGRRRRGPPTSRCRPSPTAGGIGLFGRPAGEMKCAGAPLKYAFITEDTLDRRGTRTKRRAHLFRGTHNRALFRVPIVAEKVRMLFGERGIGVAATSMS
jgi:sulfide:quinone oxidoreductase